MSGEIYGIADEAGTIVYVGATKHSAHHRMNQHRFDAKHRRTTMPLHDWMRAQMDRGHEPEHRVLEVVKDEDWQAAEQRWIAHYRSLGSLLNLTAGGIGLIGYALPTKHRAGIGRSKMRGMNKNCLVCDAQFWAKQSAVLAGNAKYCSAGCYHTSTRKRPIEAALRAAQMAEDCQ